MVVRILSLRDAAPEERTPVFGRYALVLEADGERHDFLFTVELPPGGTRTVQWEPAQSVLSDPAVPTLVVASLSDTVERYHRGETVMVESCSCPDYLDVTRGASGLRLDDPDGFTA